jgi:membrane protein
MSEQDEIQPTSARVFASELYRIWITERPSVLAASLAYYGIFSFVPVIFIAFTVAGVFIDVVVVADQFVERIEQILGQEAAAMIEEMLISVAETTSTGSTLTTIIGVLGLLFAASLIFFQLQYVLNTIWQVPRPTRGETMNYVRGRFLAFVMVLGAGLLVVLAVIANLLITIFGSVIGLDILQIAAGLLLYLALATFSLAMIYKFLPNVEISWRDVLLGSFITAVAIVLASYAYGFYLRTRNIGSALDAAGTMAVFLLFFYFLAQIFVLGAVCTRVYVSMYGSKITPSTPTDNLKLD